MQIKTCISCGIPYEGLYSQCPTCRLREETRKQGEENRRAQERNSEKNRLSQERDKRDAQRDAESQSKEQQRAEQRREDQIQEQFEAIREQLEEMKRISKVTDEKCPTCNNNVKSDWERCLHCGVQLQLICENCGQKKFSGYIICSSCGLSKDQARDKNFGEDCYEVLSFLACLFVLNKDSGNFEKDLAIIPKQRRSFQRVCQIFNKFKDSGIIFEYDYEEKNEIFKVYFQKEEIIISDKNIDNIVNHIFCDEIKKIREEGARLATDFDDVDDVLYDQALKIVFAARQGSTSVLQRRLKLGFGRAARLLDRMETEGIIGPAEHNQPRKLLIDPAQYGNESHKG